MSAETIALRERLIGAYNLEGMVPCALCGVALHTNAEYEAAVGYDRSESGRITAVHLPDRPTCEKHVVEPKATKRKR